MAQDTLVGSRIRERRVLARQKQADLAKAVGISPSYLNLIEHNKRKIGGKLLMDIAQELAVDMSLLSEGAEANLVAVLRNAAADRPDADPEVDRIDEFAGRFPGWAKVIAHSHESVQKLQHTVETLSDRMSHDPYLATSMHEVLSMVSAIHSTAGILHEGHDIEPEWRARFVRNINEDSLRLSESAQSLVQFLDGGDDPTDQKASPQQEVEQFFEDRGFHFPELEGAGASPDMVVRAAEQLKSASAQKQATRLLRQYTRDATRVPLVPLKQALHVNGLNPAALAKIFEASAATILRRLAVMPTEDIGKPLGLVVCDAAGTLLFRKEVRGFGAPKFSAACAKWPLFEALARPVQPLRRVVEVPGRDHEQFECFAISEPVTAPSFDHPPLYHAHMLVVPADVKQENPLEIGTTCRICPRENCRGRHTPSVLAEGI